MELSKLVSAYKQCYQATNGDSDAAISLLFLWVDCGDKLDIEIETPDSA